MGLKGFSRKRIPGKSCRRDMVDRIKAILARLHQAEAIDDMNVHSYRLHPLKGAGKGSGASR